MKNVRILVVKLSSLGDIVQAFDALHYLRRRFRDAEIDWAIEENFAPLVSSHPFIHRVIAFPFQAMKKREKGFLKRVQALRRNFSFLRKEKYDFVFDLQGNTKSGLVTLLAKGEVKVGFGRLSVREWPNLLATHHRFNLRKTLNMRRQYLQLVQTFFGDDSSPVIERVQLGLKEEEKERLMSLIASLPSPASLRVMVCPGSKWKNKQLSFETQARFLELMREKFDASFLFLWGQEIERALCLALQSRFPDRSCLVEKLPLPVWQNLMSKVDLVFAVDSSALHLCGTTKTPSFAVFGPTSSQVFNPLGSQHGAFQGVCPYGQTFEKTCPILRSCPTAACIQHIDAEELFSAFSAWWQALHK